jgi:hypothetical protein
LEQANLETGFAERPRWRSKALPSQPVGCARQGVSQLAIFILLRPVQTTAGACLHQRCVVFDIPLLT